MKKSSLYILMVLLFVFLQCSVIPQTKYVTKEKKDPNGYTYAYVTNDPFNVRIYTLKNGLKIYMTVNKDQPRIQTYIGVKAGGKNDPPETTGLAHYLEHVLFKGSDEIGTLNWEAEKKILSQISDLYEKHRNTDNKEEKAALYQSIDQLSQQAAQYVIPNEYDKLTTLIGAQATNAQTGNEMTVFQNDIPSNELKQWIILERERFSQLVLRLFHTELETVYEEFNSIQNNDYRRLYFKLMEGLFQKHPYGTQTVIGTAEDLKNPSMKNIHEFFNTYYVPKNMAIFLSGDLDMEETIQWFDQYWSEFKPDSQPVPEFTFEKEDPITETIQKEVFGPNPEMVMLAFRFDGVNSDDEKMVSMIDMLLNNSNAGLIDLNLMQAQKVLSAYSYPNFKKDYGTLILGGRPKAGQSLEEVEQLLLDQLEHIKNGEFDSWLLEAIINDFKLYHLKQFDSNKYRAYSLLKDYITDTSRKESLNYLNKLRKISKKQIMDFTKEHFNQNYVVAYKRVGKAMDIVTVEKPHISPININRSSESDFVKKFKELPTNRIAPVYVDYKNAIQKETIYSDVTLNYIQNKENDLFNLYFIFDMGKNHDLLLPIAAEYFLYLGTNDLSAEDLKKELYKLGLSMNMETKDDQTIISISGLNKSFMTGLKLLENLIQNIQPDPSAYDNLANSIIKKRLNAQSDKDTIMYWGLLSYVKYGDRSSFKHRLSHEKLKKLDPKTLTDKIRQLFSFQHHIFYYGPQTITQVTKGIQKNHHIKLPLSQYPEKTTFREKEIDKRKVYFVDYDVFQTELVLLAKVTPFNKGLISSGRLFNEFYGSGMSSIFFQEIRESKGLAYSAYSFFSIPLKQDRSHYLYAFIETQPDKLNEVIQYSFQLLNQMPVANQQFEASKQSLLKQIENERITKENIYWTYQQNLKRGFDYDYRKDIYEKIQTVSIEDMEQFFSQYISENEYAILLLGNKKFVNFTELSKYGRIDELNIPQLF